MTNLSQRSITYIDLVLKGKWYDLIESGEKTSEYRRACPHWLARVCDDPVAMLEAIAIALLDSIKNAVVGENCLVRDISFPLKHHYVRLRRGYGKDAPSMMFYIGDTACVSTPPVEVQEELGTDPVLELKLLQRIA